MKAVLMSRQGIALSRDVLAELQRRTLERLPENPTPTQVATALSSAISEFESEIDQYAKSLEG